MLRFHQDGVLHSVHRDNDFPEASEAELAQLLTTGDQHSFQIFVRRCGHGAPLTAGDIRVFSKVWKIPDYLWIAILGSNNRYSKSMNDAGSERFGIMSTQVRSVSMNKNHLYVPDTSSGETKSGSSPAGS